MKDRTKQLVEDFFGEHEELNVLKHNIFNVCNVLLDVYKNNGKVLICGNGGSCADADHIVGELMKGFILKRPLNEDIKQKFKSVYGEEGELIGESLQGGLPAISLNVHSALMSAFSNDVSSELIYAQQVMGYATKCDAVIGISTSGNAANIANALMTANVMGVKTIALSGRDGGKISKISDYSIIVPKQETYKIQEYHLMIYHLICAFVESEMFSY